jgi:hypothetical protein
MPPAAVPGSAPVCPSDRLVGAFRDTQGAAGHLYGDLVLRNNGPAACRLVGYPDVRFADAAGAIFGAAASHDDGAGPGTTVVLAPGDSAAAVLRITQAGLQRGCQGTGQTRRATALRVTPPGGRTGAVPITLATGVTACLSADVRQLLVGPFAAH